MKKIIYLLVAAYVLVGTPAFGQDIDDHGYLSSSYRFYLYFDNGALSSNKDFTFAYDVVPVPPTNIKGDYRVEIADILGRVVTVTYFDPIAARVAGQEFIDVYAPYRPDGKEAVFYDHTDAVKLRISVRESSFCDDDAVCESEYGEDGNSCPHDCGNVDLAGVTPSPSATPTPDQRGGFIWMILGAGAFIALLVYVIRAFRSGHSTRSLPVTDSKGTLYEKKKE